jgi:hypothetical protein
VSGISDVLFHLAIFIANLSRNWFARAMFNAVSGWFRLPKSVAQVHHSPLPRNEQRYEMGRHAQSAWIIRVFAALLAAATPTLALATATAQGVALNASAGCGNGNLDITLTTVGANREGWRATNLAGSTLSQGEGAATGLSTFSGTFTGFQLVFSPSQPADTQVASYAYVGETPPDASNTAEFFVFYDCTSRTVLLSCFGPYGGCPQTAQQALAALSPKVPTLGALALLGTIVLVAGAGGRVLSRRT